MAVGNGNRRQRYHVAQVVDPVAASTRCERKREGKRRKRTLSWDRGKGSPVDPGQPVAVLSAQCGGDCACVRSHRWSAEGGGVGENKMDDVGGDLCLAEDGASDHVEEDAVRWWQRPRRRGRHCGDPGGGLGGVGVDSMKGMHRKWYHLFRRWARKQPLR